MKIGCWRSGSEPRLKKIENGFMETKKFKMKLKNGDLVIVIAGKDKGKQGKITNVYLKDNKVTVEGVNTVKRHKKATQANAIRSASD